MVLRKLHAKVHMQLLLKLQVHLKDFNRWGLLKDPHRETALQSRQTQFIQHHQQQTDLSMASNGMACVSMPCMI
jgi:hypothetical protein